MESFWGIIRGWNAFGQGIFFLIVLAGIAAIIQNLAYYITVAIKGWPPPHVKVPNIFRTEEGESDET
jgi:hypothetical protein